MASDFFTVGFATGSSCCWVLLGEGFLDALLGDGVEGALAEWNAGNFDAVAAGFIQADCSADQSSDVGNLLFFEVVDSDAAGDFFG